MAAPYEVDGKTVLVMTVEKGDNPALRPAVQLAAANNAIQRAV